jgi:hypothetical protein
MNDKTTLDIQPGMVFRQRYQNLFFIIKEQNKKEITFQKIQNSADVVVKTTTELYELLESDKWIMLSHDEALAVIIPRVQNASMNISKKSDELKKLKLEELYFLELKGRILHLESNIKHRSRK